jgi:hypothetical protein
MFTLQTPQDILDLEWSRPTTGYHWNTLGNTPGKCFEMQF